MTKRALHCYQVPTQQVHALCNSGARSERCKERSGEKQCNMLARAARRVAGRTTRRHNSVVGDNKVVRMQTEDPRMSKIVIHNGIVYTSGQTGGDAGDCVKLQTQATLAKVDALLAEAKTSKSHALAATIWLKDIDRDFKAFNEVWNAWVDPDNKPVRATVQAAMARPVLLVEIQVTAALDRSPFEDLEF